MTPSLNSRVPKFMMNEEKTEKKSNKGVRFHLPFGTKFLAPIQTNLTLFISIFLFLWAATSVITLLTYKPSYTSQSMVIIKDTALTARYVTNDPYETTTSLSTSSVINTMGLLKVDVYKRKLWEFFQQKHPEELTRLKLKTYEQWDQFFGDGSDFISYANAPGTDLINLEFKWNNPQIAKEALDVVIDSFRGLSLKLNQSEQRERGQFLAGQTHEIQSKLTLVRYKISQLKEANSIIDLTEENANLARVRLNLRTDLKTASAEASGKNQQLAGYQQLLGMNPKQAVLASAIGRNEVLSKLQSELYTLRAERNSLLTRYTDNSVKVQDVNNRIKQLEANIEKELKRTVGRGAGKKMPVAVSDITRSDAISRMINAKTDAMELGTKSQVLQQYLNELDRRAKTLNQVSVALANYKLEESTLDESLKVLKEKELDAKLKESQMLSNVFIVEDAQVPLKSDFPQQKHLLIIDCLLSLILAFGATFLKFLFWKSEEEINDSLSSNTSTYVESPKRPDPPKNNGSGDPQFVEIRLPINRYNNNLPAYQNYSPFHTGEFVYPHMLEGSKN